MRKGISLLLCVALAGSLLAGCQSEKNDKPAAGVEEEGQRNHRKQRVRTDSIWKDSL